MNGESVHFSGQLSAISYQLAAPAVLSCQFSVVSYRMTPGGLTVTHKFQISNRRFEITKFKSQNWQSATSQVPDFKCNFNVILEEFPAPKPEPLAHFPRVGTACGPEEFNFSQGSSSPARSLKKPVLSRRSPITASQLGSAYAAPSGSAGFRVNFPGALPPATL
jgi:hypothetical protein